MSLDFNSPSIQSSKCVEKENTGSFFCEENIDGCAEQDIDQVDISVFRNLNIDYIMFFMKIMKREFYANGKALPKSYVVFNDLNGKQKQNVVKLFQSITTKMQDFVLDVVSNDGKGFKSHSDFLEQAKNVIGVKNAKAEVLMTIIQEFEKKIVKKEKGLLAGGSIMKSASNASSSSSTNINQNIVTPAATAKSPKSVNRTQHELIRLLHMKADPQLTSEWSLVEQQMSRSELDMRKSEDYLSGYEKLAVSFNDYERNHYVNVCYSGKYEDNTYKITTGMEAIHKRCAYLDPNCGTSCDTVRDASFIRDQWKELRSNLTRAFVGFTASGRQDFEVERKYDLWAQSCTKCSDAVVYSFALFSYQWFDNLGKALPSTIRRDSGLLYGSNSGKKSSFVNSDEEEDDGEYETCSDSDDSSNYHAKSRPSAAATTTTHIKRKRLSTNFEAVRKREQRQKKKLSATTSNGALILSGGGNSTSSHTRAVVGRTAAASRAAADPVPEDVVFQKFLASEREMCALSALAQCDNFALKTNAQLKLAKIAGVDSETVVRDE